MRRALLLIAAGFVTVLAVRAVAQSTSVTLQPGESVTVQAAPAQTVTVTQTISPTSPPPSPSSSTSPPPTSTVPPPTTTATTVPIPCQGVPVGAGANLAQVIGDGAGKTYCLSAGTFNVTGTVTFDNNDQVIGAGRDKTFVKGIGGAQNLFTAKSGATWAVKSLDISGAVGDDTCDPNCGRAFIGTGDQLTITDVRCHDNENQCVGSGSADVIFTNNECDHNGNLEFVNFVQTRSASCVKRIRGASTAINTVFVGNYCHDNGWECVWFDFYEGQALVEGNTIVNNGKAGVGWEVSGGWNDRDQIVVRDNTIQGNGKASYANVGSGIVCNTCAQMTVENNRFGNNGPDGGIAFIKSTREWGAIIAVIVRNNLLNGDKMNCLTPGVTCTTNS